MHIFVCLSRAAFESVVGSMLSVGFSEDEIVSVVALLAGVILIGDIVSSTLYCKNNYNKNRINTTNIRNVFQ